MILCKNHIVKYFTIKLIHNLNLYKIINLLKIIKLFKRLNLYKIKLIQSYELFYYKYSQIKYKLNDTNITFVKQPTINA